MHVDVNDILQQGEGAQVEFSVQDESPDLEGINLAKPIDGNIRIIGTKEGVLAAGDLVTTVELECDRCLRAFEHELEFPFESEFSLKPDEEQFLIDKKGTINLAEPIRQEIDVRLPLQRLCQEDCSGIK